MSNHKRKVAQRLTREQKTTRQRTLAGPGNYFITVADNGIRVPFSTGAQMNVRHNERFSLIKRDWRTLVFGRDDYGPVICKHYKNTIMFYGQLLIKEKGIKLGRYHLAPKESTENRIVFKYDPSWV